jgi:hypothetical protein
VRRLGLLCAFWLSGCLYSTHHFHSGVLLPPGRSQTTLGAGRQPLWRCSRPQPDTLAFKQACNENDSGVERVRKTEVFKGSVDYRLGLRDRWGPFSGAELQWHMEVPTNPASMEFSLNLGLPAASFHHKIGAGWGIGAWADNSVFMEYAASKQLGAFMGFGNFRTTWLATQIGDVMGEEFAKPFPSNQHLVFQTGLGLSYFLPDWIIAPDFVVPYVSLTLPQVPSGDQKFKAADIPLEQWDVNLGMGWAF